MNHAERVIRDGAHGNGPCRGGRLKVEALYKSGRLGSVDLKAQPVIDACVTRNDLLNASATRTYIARFNIEQGHFEVALKVLTEHYDDVRRTRYARLVSECDSLLAVAYRETGNTELVRHHALSAVAGAVPGQITEPVVTAYRLLYLLAKERGDARAALMYHEKYAAADKGYLDDVSARQLAYQRANHDAMAKKLQIDSLNKRNEVLQLQQALDRKAAETSRLYIILLITVLAFIALWAYRTKRSQLHFMRLARLDGLTGIANRPHFIKQAERVLESGRRMRQEVCAVLWDLDHFKAINDQYGHATGDFVLKQAVAACLIHLRGGDLFGRFGCEEFCLLLPGCSLAQARQRCEELRVAVASVAAHSGSMVANVSASLGVAATASSGYELRQLLAHADAELYRAKHTGRNCVVLHDDATHDADEPPAPGHPREHDAGRA